MAAKMFLETKSGVWFAQFYLDGRRYKRSSGTTNKAAAKAYQAKVSHRLELYRAGLLPIPEGKTLRSVIFDVPEQEPEPPVLSAAPPKQLEQFLEDYLRLNAPPAKAERTHQTEKLHVRHLLRFADGRGGRKQAVAGLSSRWFEEYKAERARKVRTVTVNKELATFRYILQSAVRDGLLASNPVVGVSRFKIDSYEGRFLSGEEVERALAQGARTRDEERRLRRFRSKGSTKQSPASAATTEILVRFEKVLSKAHGVWRGFPQSPDAKAPDGYSRARKTASQTIGQMFQDLGKEIHAAIFDQKMSDDLAACAIFGRQEATTQAHGRTTHGARASGGSPAKGGSVQLADGGRNPEEIPAHTPEMDPRRETRRQETSDPSTLKPSVRFLRRAGVYPPPRRGVKPRPTRN